MKQAVKPGEIKPILAKPYVPSAQMRQAAERLQGLARPVSMVSKVSNYRQMGE